MTANEKSAALANYVRREVARDPKIKRYRQQIQDRVTVIQQRCAKHIDEMMRKEFLLRMKSAGVPVMPQETKRWSEERHEIIKT